ncbi:DUF4132 domain-containing protein [Flectobacillus sp. BAB-3569]|uniref:DUF4132 domain-containing protein n=1 Tax=Flectobacillus sp. BAB-3569 TaxID=1509483 RepID=UPI000BA416E4|nr:DUF4132 domain-containing protein [Flectobacillus sp. BAB-3569]PAC33211.1 hypothetical protein BWI92_01510 [Flectobacillus sp. BAB-3569]
MKNLERLEAYIKNTKALPLYTKEKHEFDKILNYLSGQENNLSTIYLNRWDIIPLDSLLGKIEEWDEWEEMVMEIMTQKSIWTINNHYYSESGGFIWFMNWASSQINNSSYLKIEKVIQKALFYVKDFGSVTFFISKSISLVNNKEPSLFGEYVLGHVDAEIGSLLNAFQKSYINLVELLVIKRTDLVDQHLKTFTKHTICYETILKYQPNKYEPIFEEEVNNDSNIETKWMLFHLLLDYCPEKYQTKKELFYVDILHKEETKLKTFKRIYSSRDYKLGKTLSSLICSFLLDVNIAKYKELIHKHLKIINSIPFDVVEVIASKLKEDSLDILIEALHQDPNNLPWNEKDFFKKYFKIIESLDFRSHQQYFWDLSKNKSKELRRFGAGLLSKLGPDAIPNASELTKSKKLEARQMGFLILSLINTDESKAILVDLLEQEKNDEARDIILESLRHLVSQQNSLAEINTKIALAQKRGKLNTPLTPWLDEKILPPLYFKDGSQLSVEAFRFLHYRMSRAKEIRIDLEAKLLIEHLDTDKNNEYASSLLDAYFINGALANFKFCLILASIFGDTTVIRQLRNKVQEFADNNRGKMAEYVVKALALNGGTEALRHVEFFSRKYKNKNKNVGAAATESFSLVAEELGISPYDLADQIIPDFGFEGLFKTFEVDGQEYRAFVNQDFKILFLNEDNKTLKALPKGTPIALQDEFKEIGKEIKDIVKSQTPRLEQYLIIQRQWDTEKWQSLFLNNPIMFVYATRLIWGTFNEQKQLLFTFKVQEDQTCINQDGDEVEFQEGQMIRMVHPLILETETINYWSEVLEDEGLSPAFLQLNRAVVNFDPADNGTLISAKFSGIQMSGYTFVSMLEKRGWFRGSVVDSGFISNYYKNFAEEDITAIITQEGEVCVGYLDSIGGIGNLMFVKYGSVDFGSYTYDEPEQTNDQDSFHLSKSPLSFTQK